MNLCRTFVQLCVHLLLHSPPDSCTLAQTSVQHSLTQAITQIAGAPKKSWSPSRAQLPLCDHPLHPSDNWEPPTCNPAGKVGRKHFFDSLSTRKSLIPTFELGMTGTCDFLPETCFFMKLGGLNPNFGYFANNSNNKLFIIFLEK